MALIDIPFIVAGERRRYPYSYYSSATIAATTTTSAFPTENMTGCVVWFKATSTIGTPSITLTLETSYDDTNANYLQVDAAAEPTFPVTIADELVHVIAVNFSQMHNYARFKITLGGGDPGDDVVTMKVAFQYGDFVHPADVSITADTEFPAAAALSDAMANPTTTNVGSCTMLYNGATWDRARNGAGTATLAMRQTLASDDPAVVALQVIDDWDESDRAKVNIVVGQAGITAGAGAVAANTPRMTLASDDPAVVALQIMDDWDESDRAKVNIIVGQAGITAGAGAVAANTPRVTHASDDPVTVSLQLIDDAIYTDDAAFTPTSSKGIMIMGECDETAPTSATEGRAAGVRITTSRFLKVSMGDLLSGEDQTNNVLQVVEKPNSVSTYTPDNDTSTALEASSVTKASAGNLYGFSASNTNATGHWIQFFNSTTLPADATVPVLEFAISGEGTIEKEWPKGRNFTTGMVWCISSTNGAKTIAGATALVDVNYK